MICALLFDKPLAVTYTPQNLLNYCAFNSHIFGKVNKSYQPVHKFLSFKLDLLCFFIFPSLQCFI